MAEPPGRTELRRARTSDVPQWSWRGLVSAVRIASASFALVSLFAGCASVPLPAATPEAVGRATERLAEVDEFIDRMQREHKVAGAVTLIARHGKLVALKAHGFADLESKRAMRVDDLFQLQSMTKPIATVAALQLMERGQIKLSDPVSKFLPAFADISPSQSSALAQQANSTSSRPHGPLRSGNDCSRTRY